jgi:hypothetical protein
MDKQTDKRMAPEQNSRNQDLQDSQHDRERLIPDEATIDLPEVRDIPGQEHIHVLPLGELADTTISSDDEEGVGLFEEDEEDEIMITMGTENDIPKEERVALENQDNLNVTSDDDSRLLGALPDNEDFEGDDLNENADNTGRDLDVPGSEDDDASENIGEEDEENNQYSLGSDRNDEMTEGTP